MALALDDVESKLVSAHADLAMLSEKLQTLTGFDETLGQMGASLEQTARSVGEAALVLKQNAEALATTIGVLQEAVQALRLAAPQRLAEDVASVRTDLATVSARVDQLQPIIEGPLFKLKGDIERSSTALAEKMESEVASAVGDLSEVAQKQFDELISRQLRLEGRIARASVGAWFAVVAAAIAGAASIAPLVPLVLQTF